jgi:hypothetical protein
MRRRGETVKPKAMLALSDLEGPTKACRDVGISTTTWHKSKKAGEITKAYEIAAAQVLAMLADTIDDADLTPQQRRGLEYARKHLLPKDRSPNASVVTETVPDAITMPSAPPPAEEPSEDTQRKLMLVEGTPKALKALRDAATWLGVRTEVDP